MSAVYKTSTPFQYGGGDGVLTLSPGKQQGCATLSIESVTQRGVDGGGSIDLNPPQLRDLAAHLNALADKLDNEGYFARIPEGYTTYEDWDKIYFRGDGKSSYVSTRDRAVQSVSPDRPYTVKDGSLRFEGAPAPGERIVITLADKLEGKSGADT